MDATINDRRVILLAIASKNIPPIARARTQTHGNAGPQLAAGVYKSILYGVALRSHCVIEPQV